MSHQNSGPRNYIHKDLHDAIVKKLQEHYEKELLVIKQERDDLKSIIDEIKTVRHMMDKE